MFSWFFMILVAFCWCLCNWRNSHLCLGQALWWGPLEGLILGFRGKWNWCQDLWMGSFSLSPIGEFIGWQALLLLCQVGNVAVWVKELVLGFSLSLFLFLSFTKMLSYHWDSRIQVSYFCLWMIVKSVCFSWGMRSVTSYSAVFSHFFWLSISISLLFLFLLKLCSKYAQWIIYRPDFDWLPYLSHSNTPQIIVVITLRTILPKLFQFENMKTESEMLSYLLRVLKLALKQSSNISLYKK